MAKFYCKCGRDFSKYSDFRIHYSILKPNISSEFYEKDIKEIRRFEREHHIEKVRCCGKEFSYDDHVMHSISNH